MLDFIFPAQCVHCKKVGAYLCADCRKKLHPHPQLCPFCHAASMDGATCFSCANTSNVYLDGCSVGFVYDDVLKSLLLKLKYQHRKHIATFLAQQLYMIYSSTPTLQSRIAASHGGAYIVGVPAHRWRHYMVKGYNQSYVLAEELSQLAHIPYKKLFYKTKRTRSQVELTRQERKQNLTNVFRVYHGCLFKDTVIVIVDDLLTTGATLNELAKEAKTLFPDVTVRGCVVARKA